LNLFIREGSIRRTSEYSPKSSFKTLIPEDAILILAILASKTIQHIEYAIEKEMQLCTHTDAE
jgi:hypothetical protein